MATFITSTLAPRFENVGAEVLAQHRASTILPQELITVCRPEPTPLPIAIRVYPKPNVEEIPRSHKSWEPPEAMFVFDTETRIDTTQRLMFGSYRFVLNGRCLEEGLFYADGLSENERTVLQEYVRTHAANTVEEGDRRIRLLTRCEFLDRLYTAVYKARCLLVGLNLPFDLSRIAYDCVPARGRFAGGFSLKIWSYLDALGGERGNQFRPRVGIKHIDSKRALKGFTARNSPDRSDLIPDGSPTGDPKEGYVFRGHFADLRTVAFALFDRSFSLESLCEELGVEHAKLHPASHGQRALGLR